MEVIYSSVKDIERLYKGLADESRMKILFLLDELGEACVRDIQQVLKVPQPTVSRHLGLLKRMGVVDNHRRGKWNYYYVVKKQPEVVKQLIHSLTNLESCRKIFKQELQSQIEKLLPRPKVRRG
ncbi:MAG: metalloregulator ArsR/SmtB family transcription factor [bacterium]|nr:metalloregulator ArsR/SmtB family transcription factor [bacterium]